MTFLKCPGDRPGRWTSMRNLAVPALAAVLVALAGDALAHAVTVGDKGYIQ